MKLFMPVLFFLALGTGTSAPPPPRTSGGHLYIPIEYEGMDYERAGGYWRSEVRKHGFFNVTSFKKLNLDRQKLVVCIVLGYLSAPKRAI